ncbi:MAG: hypothetical protein PHG19_04120 [Anaerotignum sp.]|nr:hypothetical protein [Anaerotignum sp.]
MSKNEERQTRIIIRRLNRQATQGRLLTVKILALWLLCAFVVLLVAVAFTGYPDTLFWVLTEAICLVVAAVVMVLATLNEIERIKKSPRNSHSKRGQR